MKIAPLQANEQEHLNSPIEPAVQTLQESDFNDICRMVAEICHSPITLISLIDAGRKWFLSHHPLITAELSADFAFCGQARHHPRDIFIVSDLVKDHRFERHLLVTAIPFAAFYCGLPLVDSNANVLGVINIWDNKARELSAAQIAALQAVARQAAAKMELKQQLAQREQKEAELKAAYADLESFSTIAAHDLKGPLNAIISLTDLLISNYDNTLDEEGNEYISFLHTSARNLSELITSILNYSRFSHVLADEKQDVHFAKLVGGVVNLFRIPANASVIFEKNDSVIHTNRTALLQILLNLIDNAIKFNDKEEIKVEISLAENPDAYTISVKDNGAGIPAQGRDDIFELFKKMPNKTGDKSLGIGLAIVKRLTEKLGGKVSVASEPSVGSTFTVTLPK